MDMLMMKKKKKKNCPRQSKINIKALNFIANKRDFISIYEENVDTREENVDLIPSGIMCESSVIKMSEEKNNNIKETQKTDGDATTRIADYIKLLNLNASFKKDFGRNLENNLNKIMKNIPIETRNKMTEKDIKNFEYVVMNKFENTSFCYTKSTKDLVKRILEKSAENTLHNLTKKVIFSRKTLTPKILTNYIVSNYNKSSKNVILGISNGIVKRRLRQYSKKLNKIVQ